MATWPAHRELQYIIGVEERCDQRGTGSLERTSVNDRNGSRLCENARAPFSCVNFSHVDAISGDFSHRIRPLAILRGERKVFSHSLGRKQSIASNGSARPSTDAQVCTSSPGGGHSQRRQAIAELPGYAITTPNRVRSAAV